MKITIQNMKIDDFLQNPIWTWEDDDNNEIIPIKYEGYLSNSHDALFIKSDLILNDRTGIIGVICVRMSDHQIYLLEIPTIHGAFLQLPLHPTFIDDLQIQKKDLCNLLKKPIEQIFPIIFDTPFVFSNGVPLKGKIRI